MNPFEITVAPDKAKELGYSHMYLGGCLGRSKQKLITGPLDIELNLDCGCTMFLLVAKDGRFERCDVASIYDCKLDHKFDIKSVHQYEVID